MKAKSLTDQFKMFLSVALRLSDSSEADALLMLRDAPTDWKELKKLAKGRKIVIAADIQEQIEGAEEAGLDTVLLEMPESPVYEKLTHALLESVVADILTPGDSVVAIYNGFDSGTAASDSISLIRLNEHLGRLTSRDLRQLETSVPLEVLKLVVDLAVEIGREGREGKPVGTMLIVGDTRKVLSNSFPMGFDPVKGYSRKERNISDARVREGVKEVAQMDGAFIIAPDGTIEASGRFIEAPAANITLSKGLGSKHWAAAAITKVSKSVAVVVSESNGTVRIFQNGEIVLRIEPFRRAMKWKDFEFDPPGNE